MSSDISAKKFKEMAKQYSFYSQGWGGSCPFCFGIYKCFKHHFLKKGAF